MHITFMIEEMSRLGFTDISINASGSQEKLVEEYENSIKNTVQIPYRKVRNGFLDSYLAHKIEKEQILRHLQISEPFSTDIAIADWLLKFPELPPTTSINDLESGGFEAIAYYRSFHYEPQFAWGIYIKKSGIQFIAELLLQANVRDRLGNKLSQEKCLNIAYFLILFHELYHFLIDLLAVKQEISDQRPYYHIYKQNHYWRFLEKSNLHNEGEPMEEAMANAFAFRMLLNEYCSEMFASSINLFAMADAIRGLMCHQPSGYRDFERYCTDSQFLLGNSLMLMKILDSETKQPTDESWYVFEPVLADLEKSQVPVYLLNE
jgi:hypothetical protein